MSLPGDAVASAITASGLSIYDLLDDHPELFFDVAVLEQRLAEALRGQVWNFPIRTRSKVAKEAVCHALGYPVPSSFQKTQPRFPGQDLDIFVQKSNNLQIWNEEVSQSRRYGLIRLNEDDVVIAVRVLTGEAVALLDKTGTLTSKFQAARRAERSGSTLVSESDTENFVRQLFVERGVAPADLSAVGPLDRPTRGRVLPIDVVYSRLAVLVGESFDDPGLTRERSRGEVAQKLATAALGLGEYADFGQFPDILNQALEIKLQLSPTVDLGVVSPDSTEEAAELDLGLRHCDTRYAIFFGERTGETAIRINEVVVTTGADFFSEFRKFEGRVVNRKLQIPLPDRLWESEREPD